MTRMRMVVMMAGLLAGAAGAEAGYVESYIYLQKQGAVCRGTVIDKGGVYVSNSDDGVEWHIENLSCDEPAYVEIKSDIANLMPLPPSCQTTYKVPDDTYFPPRCDFPHLPAYGGTYGFNVYVNCEPGHVCVPADPEIVVERDGLTPKLLNARVMPSAQFLRVPVTLVREGGRCQGRVAQDVAVDKKIKAIEWTFENQCDKEAHYVDLRRVLSVSTGRPMISRDCSQTVTLRQSPMVIRCPLENALDTAATYQYSVAVDCIGKAPCTPITATLKRAP
jgi:hypothetical protein